MCTTDIISEVGVDISSAHICKRDLITKTFASTNTSYNIGKNRVSLTGELDPIMIESIVIIYELQKTNLRSKFICHSHGCIEEV